MPSYRHGPVIVRHMTGLREVNLFKAVELGWMDRIEELLNDNPDFVHGSKYPHGGGPLHIAIKFGKVDVAERLVQLGASIAERTTNDALVYPVHIAAENGQLAALYFLVKKGADVNVVNSQQMSPLHYAALNGHETLVYALIAMGCDPTAATAGGETPLHLAAFNGHSNLVRYFLNAGADVNAVNMHGQNAMHYASKKGDWKSMQLLAEKGVDLTQKDDEGFTPEDWTMRKEDRKKRYNAVVFYMTEKQKRVKGLKKMLYRILKDDKSNNLFEYRYAQISILCLNLHYLLYVHALLAPTHQLLFIATLCFMWFMWWWVVRTDPGTYARSPEREKAYFQQLATFADTSLSEEEAKARAKLLCHTCKLVKPVRCHHTPFMNCCILDYDHYCGFMYHVIGYKNRRGFMVVLVLLAFTTSFCTYQGFYHVPAEVKNFTYYLIYFFVALSAFIAVRLFLVHWNFITKGQTLAEGMKGTYKKKRSPFDEGLVKNIRHFFSTTPSHLYFNSSARRGAELV